MEGPGTLGPDAQKQDLGGNLPSRTLNPKKQVISYTPLVLLSQIALVFRSTPSMGSTLGDLEHYLVVRNTVIPDLQLYLLPKFKAPKFPNVVMIEFLMQVILGLSLPNPLLLQFA